MKLFRGDRDALTDSKNPQQYLYSRHSPWEPGRSIRLSATINKSGDRHTHVRLVIEEEDVIALFIAFLEVAPERAAQLLAESLKAKDEEIERLSEVELTLRAGLKKVRRLVSSEVQQEIDGILGRERDSK